MVYRGFTWSLTATEVANLRRILSAHLGCPKCTTWDVKISQHFVDKCTIFLELTPDGTSPTHAHADT